MGALAFGSAASAGPSALARLLRTPLADASAETVLIGGRITTMDPAMPEVSAVAMSGGRIVSVGTDGELRSRIGPGTTVIELKGRRVIPGLNDSHCHAVRAGRFFNLEVRWDGLRSLRRGLEMVAEQAASTPPGQWVRVVGGWSPFQFEERREPTVEELNRVAPGTPAFVLMLYSKAFLNRAGCEALGLKPGAVAPKGGRYEFRDGGAILHAEPNPTILYSTIARLPQLGASDQLNGSKQYYRELSRFGLTSVSDAGGGGHTFPRDYGGTTELADRDELPVRVGSYLFPQRPGLEYADIRSWVQANRAGGQLAHRLHMLSIQGAGEFLSWSAGDYENFLAPRPTQGPEMERDLKGIIDFLVDVRWPFRIHATYEESIVRILSVLAEVEKHRSLDGVRWAIDHAETIQPATLARVKAMGGGIAIQNRMSFAGEYFVERYGAAAARKAPPLRQLVDSGVPLGLGTDSTRVASYNPWTSLQWAVTGRTVGGLELYPEEERLTREEALRLMTVGSAWFSGDGSVKGKLAPGQLADLAVLDRDYFDVPEADIDAIRSVLTICDGRVVQAAGEYADRDPGGPPRPTPEWSPVHRFGGYQG